MQSFEGKASAGLGNTAKERVLIVEDDATARLALAAMVRADDLEVVLACDGLDAMRRIDAIEPDVVICDFVMDQMRGDELSSWMKAHERWKLVPIIAVSQFDNPILHADLLGAGADSVVTKQNAPRVLEAQLRAALRMRRALVQCHSHHAESGDARLDAV